MPIPLFSPLTTPITATEINALDAVMIMADNAVRSARKATLADPTLNNVELKLILRAYTLLHMEIAELAADIAGYSEYAASDAIRLASRVCPHCDTLLQGVRYCPECRSHV